MPGLEQIRCPVCNRRLMDVKGQAQVKCPKCRSLVAIDTEAKVKVQIEKNAEDRASVNRRYG